MMTRALVLALGICAAYVALEAMLAGPGVKHQMAELRLPAYSPPFTVWIAIGLLYYAACFVVLYQLLRFERGSPAVTVGLVLILALMAVNAIWNFLFFRQKDVRASFVISLPYAALAILLLVLLFRIDSLAAWVFLPYVIYLGYAARWGYRLWRLNDRSRAAGHAMGRNRAGV